MQRFGAAVAALVLAVLPIAAPAAPALQVLGPDFVFPHRVDGMPGKLSDFGGLQIDYIVTSDGVKLSYWHAGAGQPLIFATAE